MNVCVGPEEAFAIALLVQESEYLARIYIK